MTTTPAGRRLFSNFFFLGSVQAFNSLLQLLVIPYVILVIGTDGFGVVSVAQVVMFYLSVFTEYGFNQTATRDISVRRDDSQAIATIFYRVLFTRLLLCLLSFFILLLLIAVLPLFRLHLWVYLAGFVFVVGQSALLNWFFQGIERMQVVAVSTLIARLLFVGLVFLFVRRREDDYLYLLFMGLGNLVGGLISLWVAVRRVRLRFVRPRWSDISRELKGGWQVAVSNLSGNTVQYANIFILRIFTNDFVAGYYGIAERLFLSARQTLSIASQAIYPQVCLLVSSGREAVIGFFRRVYIPLFLLVFVCAALLFWLSPEILAFFSKKDYPLSVPLLRGFSVAALVVCINIPATLVLLAIHRTRVYFRTYMLATLVNLAANCILVQVFGAMGTVLTILITELFIGTLLYFQVYRLYMKRPVSPDMVGGDREPLPGINLES